MQNLFSKRNKQKKQELQYAEMNQELKVKITLLFQEVIFQSENELSKFIEINWEDSKYHQHSYRNYIDNFSIEIYKILREEYGVYDLDENKNISILSHIQKPFEDILLFIVNKANKNQILDIVELFFKLIIENIDQSKEGFGLEYLENVEYFLNENIKKLNNIFLEHNLGYKLLQSGQIIPFESEYTHEELAKPAFLLLTDTKYKNAEDEFKDAWNHYKKGDYSDCIIDCGKAMESLIKMICKEKKYPYNESDNLNKVIQILFKHNTSLISLKSSVSGLRAAIEDSVSVIRNKSDAAHKTSEGESKIKSDQEIAKLTLDLTASILLYLSKI